MACPRLTNYLRSHRKRSGLSQSEVAFLLGGGSGSKISAYERNAREPSLCALLAFELLYEAPLKELFAGLHERVRQELARRTRLLGQRWSAAAPQKQNASPGKQKKTQDR